MPVVRPFRGILYDPDVVGRIDSVIAPPYDVVGRSEQDLLYEASPYNVIRLDLSRERDRYASARSAYREWLAGGALVRDPEPAFYVYAQRFREPDGEERERFGFFARLRLEEFGSGKVRPHEKTLASAKADRLELQRACRANLSAIFGFCSIPGWELRGALGGALEAPARIDVDDRAGVRHRLWRVTDPGLCAEMVDRLEDRTIYIADGHHRYETALRYRDEMRVETGRRSGEEPFDYVLAFLANMDEPGLVILPTHRLLRGLAIEPAALVERLQGIFRVDRCPRSAGVAGFRRARTPAFPSERRIGAVLPGLDDFLVLVARDGEPDARSSGSRALRRLDVTLLHRLVLEGEESILGFDVQREAQAGRLAYTQSDEEAVRRVENGEFAAAFLLNPTGVAEVRAVCEAGETMPEKSTYFYPKLATGLVLNSVEDD